MVPVHRCARECDVIDAKIILFWMGTLRWRRSLNWSLRGHEEDDHALNNNNNYKRKVNNLTFHLR